MPANPGQNKPINLDPEVAERAQQAVRLRMACWSYDRIAKQLGYADASGAHRAVKRVLSESIRETAEEYKDFELERIDMLLGKLIPIMLENPPPIPEDATPQEQYRLRRIGNHVKLMNVKSSYSVHRYLMSRWELLGLKAKDVHEVRILKEYSVTNDPEAL